MVFSTLILNFLNKRFFHFYSCSLLSNCYQALLWISPISSGEIQVILFNFSFIRRYFDIVCCCCLIMLFVLTRFLNIRIAHQSNASYFSPLSYLLWRLSFCSNTNFFLKNTFIFGFFYVPHLADNYAKIVDERGRNLMCNRN